MKTVYLVRHGESTANIGGIVHGGAKTALTEAGRAQATRIAERLNHLPVEVVVASTYLRAKQTGEIIASAINRPVDYSELFVEWNQGSHRIGRRSSDPALIQETKDLIDGMTGSLKVSDEEDFADLDQRAGDALTYLTNHARSHIAVVSHGWFSPVLIGKAIMGDDFTGRDCRHFMKSLRMVNTGLTVLTYDDPAFLWNPWNIITWNDHAHLG